MRLLRERTKIAPRKEITEAHLDTKWTLPEKKKLLVALRKLKPESLDQIRSEYLPHRSEKEIYWFIEKMKNKVNRKPVVSRPRVPIELWEKMAEQLTSHDVDFSYALSEVFQKIASEEEHFPKNLLENPDWKVIYLYLVALLKGDEPPEVGQIEAAVLLDLTEALAKHLKSLDTTDQRSIMIKKYDLLSARVNARSNEEMSELTRKALEEDPLALNDGQEMQPSTSGAMTPSTQNPQKTTEVSTPQQSTQAAMSNQNEAESVTPANQNEGVSVKPAYQSKATAKVVNTGLRALGARSKRGRKRKTVEIPLVVTELQKTSLYSINPFSIPIRYLNPKVKPPTPAKKVVSTSTDAAAAAAQTSSDAAAAAPTSSDAAAAAPTSSDGQV